MCQSMVNIQSPTAEIRRGKKERRRNRMKIYMVCNKARIDNRKKLVNWKDGQGDGRLAEYRWRPLRQFRNSIPCTTPQSLADARCSSAVH